MVLYDTVDKNIKKKITLEYFRKNFKFEHDAIFTKNIYISFYSQPTYSSNQQQNVMLLYYISILCPLIIHVNESNLWKKILTIFFYVFSSTSLSQGTPYILYFTLHVIYI